MDGETLGDVLVVFHDYLSALVTALATLVAAFVGAYSAFWLQSRKADRDIRKANLVAGNLAVFNLARMLNTLRNFQRQVIDPVRDKKSAFIEMPPVGHKVETDVELDLAGLAFLLLSDDPDLLGRLFSEKTKFERALGAINERSRLHIEQVQPKLEHAGLPENAMLQQIEQALGSRLSATMHQNTEQIIKHVDYAITSMHKTGAELTAILKKLFPNEKIISFAEENSDGKETQKSGEIRGPETG